LLALAGIFEIGKAHLAHGRLGSGGQAYFITSWDLFGDSLAERLQAVSSSVDLISQFSAEFAAAFTVSAPQTPPSKK
ncbi:hypothetical protein, partial [Pseudomonas syringae]|uniref:hypothetical protein n=1 Tax=Pseudomonas syringae TaxID=317 RepID=UPI001C3F358A